MRTPAVALRSHFVDAAFGDELVHRAHHVLDVDDQHRRAVFHQRARGDVLDLAEPRVERLHDQLALAEEPVDDEPVRRWRGSPTTITGELAARDLRLAAAEHLLRA